MLPDLSLAARRAWRSPWRRSYSRSKRAKWETEADYCSGGKTTAPYDKGMRLVDFIDLAILDYLMSPQRGAPGPRPKTTTTETRVAGGGGGRRPPLTLPPLSPTPQYAAPLPPSTSSLIGRSAELARRPLPEPPLLLVELPGLVARYGPGIAAADSTWKEGPRLVATALGVDIPVAAVASTSPTHRSSDTSLSEPNEDKEKTATAVDGSKELKSSRAAPLPLTGAQVLETLAHRKKRGQGALEFYCLKQRHRGDEYRPYDLEVVPPSRAGPDHYLFSSGGVRQVTQRLPGDLISLEYWRREAEQWRSLRAVPFFRDYRLHMALRWWRQNVRRMVFQRRRSALWGSLLTATPPLRHALGLLAGVNEELAALRWLPCALRGRSYTLREFRRSLTTSRGQSLDTLETLLRQRTAILHAVHQECYDAQQELQRRVDRATNEPTDRQRP
ncbi:LOW QUALITY PROTEIN: hypothetical protein CRUP_018740, partial [Coryphaenoides rupestris]